MAFLTKTLSRFRNATPNVDFTFGFTDSAVRREETVRAEELRRAKAAKDVYRMHAIQLEPTVPLFYYAARNNTDGIAMPTYDWNWPTQVPLNRLYADSHEGDQFEGKL